jgi:beta-glucosidase
MMNRIFGFLCGLLVCLSACSGGNFEYPFQDPDLSVDERVNDLVSRLTLDEKVGQMVNNAPAIARLNVPAYNYWNEALHGVARSPYPVTSFPQAIGVASTWDVNSVLQMSTYISDEGRAVYHDAVKKGKSGIYLGLTFWSPNINIFRDPRWGRGQETYGEDPFLTASIGSVFVKGLQGDDPVYLKSSACAKHYAVHSGPEWNRHTYNAEVSDFDLWDTYLPAFRELVVDAGVTGVMCAYNAYFGKPCCGNDLLMNDILKNQWNFDGYVTSDCGAIKDFYKTHNTHPDAATAAADAVLHGTDCECDGNGAYKALAEAVKSGLIEEKYVDESLKRLFKVRFKMGMFDPDSRVPYAKTSVAVLEAPEHKAHALKVAQQSIVLLKNENKTLPIDKSKVKKIAIVGPNADSESVLLANYYGYPTEITSLLEGLRAKAGNDVEIVYKKGVNLTDDLVFTSEYDPSVFSYKGNSGFGAAYYKSGKPEGAPDFERQEETVNHRWGDGHEIDGVNGIIARNMAAVFTTEFKPKKSGKVCFELVADDRAKFLVNEREQENVGNINNYYILDAEVGETYRLDIVYNQYSDNAEIIFDMGTLENANPAATAASVADADLIIYAGGISARVEGEEMGVVIEGFKRGDRTSIDLPAVQTQMLKALHATGKPVVFVLMTGSAIGLEWESKNLAAIVNAWYSGQAGGQAIADVLFGDYNPAGRLPVTFYRSVADLPDFEDYSMANRTYRYFKGEPVYPFGYGLSYTDFRYENFAAEVSADATIKVQATVTNSGEVDGDEVVQVYLTNARKFKTPIRSLGGFKRIHLKAGESQTVEIVLTSKELSVTSENGDYEPMSGDVVISIGGGQPCADAISAGKSLQQTISL